MNSDFFFTIGLMSGTSLDGIDLVYVKFDKNEYKRFTILSAETIGYSEDWKNKLKTAIHFSKDYLTKLDIEYGVLLGNEINLFIEKHTIKYIDFIASHGHTVLHQPEKGITLQIGNGQVISEITNQKVICDFRTQDVILGGQGAPLVPIGDKLLFSNYEYCVNLGGFANVSFKRNNERIAFDICPANIVLNYYTSKLGFDYDDKGRIAAAGNLNFILLGKLNSLEFYKKTPPKSLGLEWVQKNIFPLIDNSETDIPTILRTFVEHVAMQVGSVLYLNESILVTGGGVFNSFLIERIECYAGVKINIPSKKLINYKEALIFAFLGVLKNNNEINCLQTVTGASKDHSSGVLFYPQN